MSRRHPTSVARAMEQSVAAPTGDYFRHVLPGNAMTNPGDRRVSWSHAGMNTNGYKAFEQAHDSYLGVAALNLLLLTGVVTTFTHLAMMIIGQKEFKASTIADIMDGPLMLIVVGGLTGVGLLFGHMGISEKLYYSLYIPFGLIVIGTGMWAMVDNSPVNKFEMPEFDELLEFAPETIIWIGIAALVALATTMQWMRGNYRLDAMTSGSTSTLLLIFTIMFFTYGLSKVFALVLRTLDHTELDRDSSGYGLMYVISSFGMLILVVSAVKFLDTSLHFFGGHIATVFAPPAGVGASKAIIETQRAFQFAIYTVVFLSAALMWRRRSGLEKKEVSSSELQADWGSVIGLMVLIPMVAMAIEGMNEYFEVYSPLYDLIRAVLISGVILFVGTGYIPWNNITLTVAGAVVLFLALKYTEFQEDYDKPLAALCCAGVFVGSVFLYDGLTEESTPTITRAGIWSFAVIGPALLLAILSAVSPYTFGTYGTHMVRIYLAFTIVYTLSLEFVNTDKLIPFTDSPNFDITPKNSIAARVISALILMACLMTTTAVWGIIVPKTDLSTHSYYVQRGRFKVNVVALAAYGVVGLACAYMYINIRHDRAFVAFAGNAQTSLDEVQSKVIKDNRAHQ